jgi:O-methyltransferase
MDVVDLVYRGVQHYTLISPSRFRYIGQSLLEVSELDGDIAELGVYKGGSSAGMALLAPKKTLHLFDTFEGMREPQFDEPHSKGDFADTTEQSVRSLFDPNFSLKIHRGWFPETITDELRDTRFCFVHIDGDFYETTRDAINFFWPRLVKGGIMVFDDWEWHACPGVKRALIEAAETFGFTILQSAEIQAAIKKQ